MRPRLETQKMTQIKVSNRFLSDVTWEDSSGCTFSINNHADIWRINIQSNSSQLQSLSALLTQDELVKAGRFIHRHDSDRYIISRAAVRLIMGRYLNIRPSLIEIERGENKKPYIKNSLLFYNLSHSGDWIVLAISDSAIGIDTEPVNNSFDFNDIIKDYFSPGESCFINEEKSAERFFLLWTRKEALTKATGKGLDEDLKLIPSLDGRHYLERNILSLPNNWTVTSFILHNEYFASAAISDKTGDLKFWEADLSHEIFARF